LLLHWFQIWNLYHLIQKAPLLMLLLFVKLHDPNK
jgi:hypothetical protein